MDKLTELLMKQTMQKNLETLGIEKSYELIEEFKNPIYRAKMRIIADSIIHGRKSC